jgi:hydroxyacylglutathione hydrolase
MSLAALPAFADHCIWTIDDGAEAIVVDPGEPRPVAEALDARRLRLAAILVTHHDADHRGGDDVFMHMVSNLKFMPAVAPANEDIAHLGQAEGSAGSDVPAALRTWKNGFR